jgi:hypothetical protein
LVKISVFENEHPMVEKGVATGQKRIVVKSAVSLSKLHTKQINKTRTYNRQYLLVQKAFRARKIRMASTSPKRSYQMEKREDLFSWSWKK